MSNRRHFLFRQTPAALLGTSAALAGGVRQAAADGQSPVSAPEQRPATAVTRGNSPTLNWHDVAGFRIEGKGWRDTEDAYDRLPARARKLVRPEVWDLGKYCSGLYVRFVTDASTIAVRWTVRRQMLASPIMAATGVSGVDLYVRHQDQWRWIGVGRPTKFPFNEGTLIDGLNLGRREYMLYLPAFNALEFVQIGLPPDANLAPAPPYPERDAKPLVFYGTSITQGGCASRAGMTYIAILGRRLARPVINLGFSGQGRMDLEIAELLSELNAALYFLDCIANMTSAQVSERAGKFIDRLREHRPETPIVLAEYVGPYRQTVNLLTGSAPAGRSSNDYLREVFDRCVARGDKNLHYLPADELFGADGEASVDGIHPTDIGMMRFADAAAPLLSRILAGAVMQRND